MKLIEHRKEYVEGLGEVTVVYTAEPTKSQRRMVKRMWNGDGSKKKESRKLKKFRKFYDPQLISIWMFDVCSQQISYAFDVQELERLNNCNCNGCGGSLALGENDGFCLGCYDE
jgi:hypothetical protein